MPIKYKIFYDDGSTYSGEPENAPVFGALIVIQEDKEHGRSIHSMCDYFCWDDRGDGLKWWEADYIGMVDYLSRPGMKRILIGRLIPNARWGEIYKLALDDADLPPKTANSPRNHGRTV